MSFEAHGPDAFGDFNVSVKGEMLAKCVVVQNGFRTPEETAAFSAELVNSLNALPALVKALEEAKQFIGTSHSYKTGHAGAKQVMDNIGAALASVRGDK